jgi:hypothetical protein
MALALAPLGPLAAQQAGVFQGARRAVKFDVSPPLWSIAAKSVSTDDAMGRLLADPDSGLEGEPGPQDLDAAVQDWMAAPFIPAPTQSFDAMNNISGAVPPDPVGDVGPNHYIAMSNLSFAVYSKTGTTLYGPAANNTLWSGFGGDCETRNDGDPIILYDQFADRWLLSQFTAGAGTFFNCVALSTSGDPTGTYYRWAFTTGSNFPDYPKYGIWRDAYYISTREFQGSTTGPFAGVGAYAIDRAEMLAGKPNPQVISFLVPPGGTAYNIGDGLLPADIDGATLPPAGASEIFAGAMDNGGPYSAPGDALTLWRFHVDFASPGSSTFTLGTTLPIAAYDTIFGPCGGTRSCIPQPGTSNKIDILSYRQRPLHRLAYRNFGTHESLVTNQAVEGVANMAGIRWWEVRDPNGTPSIFQEGTYVPGSGDTIHRWMGSIAMDVEGNMALGYSVSNGTAVFPGIRYTGRLAGDTLGQMPQGEGTIGSGSSSQVGSPDPVQRWGDYSSMNVDPTDDCTFWYVNEYYTTPNANGVNWKLRVGAFNFTECDVADYTLGATPTAQEICIGDPAAVAVNLGALRGFASPVTLSVIGQPAGTTTGFTINPVTPSGSSTLNITNTGAVLPDAYLLTITGTAGAIVHSANAALLFSGPLVGAPTLVSPANGAIDQSTAPTLSWNAVVGAVSYLVEVDNNADFSSPEVSTTVGGTSTAVSGLGPEKAYFWRVTATNACGNQVSSAFSFTTALRFCRAPGVAIPDGVLAGVNDNLVVAFNGTILDLDVTIKASHTWVGDTKFTLKRGAAGSPVALIDQPGVPTSQFGCSNDNIEVRVNDEGPDGSIENTCSAVSPAIGGNRTGGGTLANTTLLAAFDTLAIQETWTLNASDVATPDSGTLLEWCLVPTLDRLPFSDDFELNNFSRWSNNVP